MVTIKQYYNIDGDVPFLDLDVSSDTKLFLDTRAIRLLKSPQTFADEAVACCDTFWTAVAELVIHRPDGWRELATDLLRQFTEPRATRLGMTNRGIYGHGSADDLGARVLTALTGPDIEPLIRVGVMRQHEDLPLFVDGIARDITSDIATNLMFAPLARFTAAVVAQHPEFRANGQATSVLSYRHWSPDKGAWFEQEFELPVAAGEPLLLIPRGWARANPLMSSTRFFETTVLSFVQSERAVLGIDGKILKPRKKDLVKEPALARGRATVIAVMLRALAERTDLLKQFKEFVDGRFDGSSDEL